MQERVKKVSASWKQLPPVEKKSYEDKSKKLAEAYRKELKDLPPQLIKERTRLKAERKLSLNNRRLLATKRKVKAFS